MPPANEGKMGQHAADQDVDKDESFQDAQEMERWEK